MIKILIGFILFAALAVFILMKSGADVNLGDEHAGQKEEHPAPAKTDAPAPPQTK